MEGRLLLSWSMLLFSWVVLAFSHSALVPVRSLSRIASHLRYLPLKGSTPSHASCFTFTAVYFPTPWEWTARRKLTASLMKRERKVSPKVMFVSYPAYNIIVTQQRGCIGLGVVQWCSVCLLCSQGFVFYHCSGKRGSLAVGKVSLVTKMFPELNLG